ncbi:mce related protein [Actinomadura rubteroloni]|uniref:Mce related protein n=1 Tax=Actinomadura rubteroloni TaxID=1926885 RepID=A0A2P4UJ56_9ACTN|nr:MlaD family protein [Actinomadura rubteroloni]POM25038.1 mce related protein [Actinomadura rubteroloni]
MRRVLALVLVLAALSGCSLRTAGAPHGRVSLTATFTDAQGLVAGHSVKLSDVTVGSVTGVRLVSGYRARVTMSIKDGVRLPVGTRAEVKVTSLLGENYVDLVLPPGGRLDTGPFLANHAAITDTSVQPSFEQVVGQAGPLLQALAGNDVATVVNAGATALDGNGPRLNSTIRKSAELLQMFADQRRALGEAVDNFARLGRSLAQGKDALGRAPGELAKASQVLNDDKGKIINAVEKLTMMARELNDKVLEGRVARFRTLLSDLDPVLAQLGNNRRRLTALVNGLVEFDEKLPKATWDGQILLYPILRITWPNGDPLIPDQPKAAPKASPTPSPKKSPAPKKQPGFQLPPELRKAFPDLAKWLEGQR